MTILFLETGFLEDCSVGLGRPRRNSERMVINPNNFFFRLSNSKEGPQKDSRMFIPPTSIFSLILQFPTLQHFLPSLFLLSLSFFFRS